MFIFKSLVTDEAMKGQENVIFRKIRMNVGLLDTYLICLSETDDYFEIIDCMQLKQRRYPKDSLYVMGLAKGRESAKELACSLYSTFAEIYNRLDYKQAIMNDREQLFRRR